MPDDYSKLSRSPRKFVSPPPEFEDDVGPLYIPIWQPALAALAALSSVGFAILLFTEL